MASRSSPLLRSSEASSFVPLSFLFWRGFAAVSLLPSPSLPCSGLDRRPKSVARGARVQTLCPYAPSPSAPGQARSSERHRETMKTADSPSRRPPLRRPLRARPEVSRRREAYKANSPSTCAPLRRPLRARPEVGNERRTKQTPLPAELPSAAASEPGPKSAARGVDSKCPVQLCTPSPPPPGQARSRSRFQISPRAPPPPLPGQARSRRQVRWCGRIVNPTYTSSSRIVAAAVPLRFRARHLAVRRKAQTLSSRGVRSLGLIAAKSTRSAAKLAASYVESASIAALIL